jgi:hypothetical protein
MTPTSTHAAAIFSMVASVMAFAPAPLVSRGATTLGIAADPEVATTKEYQDVCGNIFGEDEMLNRLEKTAYLYPSHVAVIEDLSEIAGKMTDEIVSCSCCGCCGCPMHMLC